MTGNMEKIPQKLKALRKYTWFMALWTGNVTIFPLIEALCRQQLSMICEYSCSYCGTTGDGSRNRLRTGSSDLMFPMTLDTGLGQQFTTEDTRDTSYGTAVQSALSRYPYICDTCLQSRSTIRSL